MPVQVSYPGVYVQEIPSGVQTITGVSTSTTLFIGMTRRGVIDRPTLVLNFSDYERKFGVDTSISETTDQVRQFFQNGGSKAYVMRIADGSTPSTVSLRDELLNLEMFLVTAKDNGVDGNSIRMEVDYDTSAPETTFNLRAFRMIPDGQGGFNELEAEVFQNLSSDPSNGNYVVDVVTQQSALINLAPGADFENPAVAPFAGYALSGRLFVDDTDLRDSFLGAIDATGPGGVGGTRGRFRVSVDGGPFTEVTVIPADLTAAANIEADLTDVINNALLAVGSSVSASLIAGPTSLGGFSYLQVSSTAAGGSMVFRNGASEDIGAALELGLENGGFEVGGNARRRPAPSGLFLRLGPLDGPVPVLTTIADQDRESIEDYTLDDSTGSYNFPVELGTAGPMFENGGDNSLRHVRARLQILADTINSDSGSDPGFDWTADMHGHRLVVTPNFGNANAVATSFSTSAAVAPFDLGGAGNGMDQPNTRYYSASADGSVIYQSSGANGFDGNIPTTQNYTDAFAITDTELDLFNLMVLPRATGQTDGAREAVWGPASAFCLARRAFLLIDPRSSWSDVSTVSQQIVDLRIGVVKDHAAVYWPKVTVRNPVTGVASQLDPSGSIAGVMARTDSNRGVWKAPAGLGADIRGIRGVEFSMSDPENGIINPQAVNAIRLFPNGIVSWGARTMDGFDNSGNSDYRYVPVRRFALFIEESLFRGLKFAVFEPNDEPLWAQIRLAAGAFMNNLFRKASFQGQKATDAYFVKVDSETTTQNDINLGIVNVLVGFAPLKPAEFVVITVQQKAGEVQI